MTPCKTEERKFKKLISGVNDKNDVLNKVLDECVSKETLIKDWTESIQGFVGDHDNHQYLPSLVKTIVKFTKFLLLWSGIMIPEFQYGSTMASSECSGGEQF